MVMFMIAISLVTLRLAPCLLRICRHGYGYDIRARGAVTVISVSATIRIGPGPDAAVTEQSQHTA